MESRIGYTTIVKGKKGDGQQKGEVQYCSGGGDDLSAAVGIPQKCTCLTSRREGGEREGETMTLNTSMTSRVLLRRLKIKCMNYTVHCQNSYTICFGKEERGSGEVNNDEKGLWVIHNGGRGGDASTAVVQQ